jgi:hypothetical protein
LIKNLLDVKDHLAERRVKKKISDLILSVENSLKFIQVTVIVSLPTRSRPITKARPDTFYCRDNKGNKAHNKGCHAYIHFVHALSWNSG